MSPNLTRFTVAGVLAALFLAFAPAAHADEWRDKQYWIKDFGFDKAWESNQGEGVTVAVIDTGIDNSHPDLTGQVANGFDPSGKGNDKGTESLGDDPDHGTMVASLLAGHGNNASEVSKAKQKQKKQDNAHKKAVKKAKEDDEDPPESPEPIDIPKKGPGKDGVIGTAPKAKLLSVSIYLGPENAPTAEDQIAEGVIWAVDNGADVINISLASSDQEWPESWDTAFKHAEDHDVVVVVAAGNRATGSNIVGAPATIPGVLTVAGVDENRVASWDSSTEGITIGVAAPADPLVGATPGGGYNDWAGTSGASPLVAGLAALIRAEHPDLSAAEVIQLILDTAVDSGEEGYDPLYGYGIIDAEAALSATPQRVETNPLGSMTEWIRIHRRGAASEPAPAGPTHSAGTAVDVPTEIPQAVPEREAEVWEPVVVVGTSVLLLITVGGLFWALARRTK